MTSVEAAVAILASAVIVLGGVAALVRSIWKIAQNLRDNTEAVQTLTGELASLSKSIDGRFDALAGRVAALESRRRWRLARAARLPRGGGGK